MANPAGWRNPVTGPPVHQQVYANPQMMPRDANPQIKRDANPQKQSPPKPVQLPKELNDLTGRPIFEVVDMDALGENDDPMARISEEMIAELKESFMLFDDDGNGHTTRAELTEAMNVYGMSDTDKEIQELIDIIDLNRNSTIEFAEYVKFMAVKLHDSDRIDDIFEIAFKMFDRNNRGYIEARDLKQSFKLMGKKFTDKDFDQMFKDGDLDQDGRITFQEFVNITLAGRW